MKKLFHILFDSGFSDHGIVGIVGIFFFQSFQFLCRRPSGIAQNRSHTFIINILTHRILDHVNSLKLTLIFHNRSHCAFAYICGNGNSHIFLETVCVKLVAHGGNIQNFLFGQLFWKSILLQLLRRIGILTIKNNRKSVASRQIIHHIFCSGRSLLFGKIINQRMTVDVGLKSAERKTFSYIKRVISVFIKCNVEVTGKTVSVF